ncbi:hypothetical protein FH972_010552 [Carpinus fangiana]|uniref:Uncharacterized protein n=1 Tax=Carpinus fangiana TaxID=176857 RepID=A0A660KQD9_9ROSI|nr:hypothetical protein FH972_010552 [Carpinus fangiana]
MGSDRKSEEKKSKKRNSYSSGSEDEGKSKRLRAEEDGERKSRKSDKKEKRTDKKSLKDSKRRHSDKEKKSKDKHKSKHHRSDRHLKLDVQELSNDDYFSKNNEFATWLKEEKNIFFSDLSSKSAHEHFSDFVKSWNDRKLESRYYEGIASAPRTSHNWKIRK